MTFDQEKEQEPVERMQKSIPGKGNSKCKGPGVGAGGGIQAATRRPVKVTRKNKGRMAGDELRESNKGDQGFQTKRKLTGHFSSYSH